MPRPALTSLALLLAALAAGGAGGSAPPPERPAATVTGSLLHLAPRAAAKVRGAATRSRPARPGAPGSSPAAAPPAGRVSQDPRAEPRTETVTLKLPNDPLFPEAWSLQAVRAPAAWRVATGRPDVVVAVLDTGVDASQPDLRGALVPGWDAVEQDADPQDRHGHGTHVAGIVAARSDNGTGVASLCWSCSVMPVRVIGDDGRGRSEHIASGIRWAVAHGARVINMSFVLSGRDADVSAAVREALDRGVVVVAAAGNSAQTDPVYPAAEPGVVSVGATDERDTPYSWSGRGSWVRIAAPGCTPTTARGAGYAGFCGTSSATAVVSGIAGLLLSARPGLSGADVAAALEAGARPVGEAAASGRVDAAAALQGGVPG